GAKDLTAAAILKQLDEYAAEDKFPRLDANGGSHPATLRLHAWRAPGRWALAIEQLSFFQDTATTANDVYTYGTCLRLGPGLHEEGMLCPTDDGPEGPTFDLDEWGLVSADARTILIRGRIVPLDLRPQALAARGIRLSRAPRVTGSELLRNLLTAPPGPPPAAPAVLVPMEPPRPPPQTTLNDR